MWTQQRGREIRAVFSRRIPSRRAVELGDLQFFEVGPVVGHHVIVS